MGEEHWRVQITGNPALDSIPAFDTRPFSNYLLVVFHPVTLEKELTAKYVDNLIAALAGSGWPVAWVLGNCDTHGRVIHQRVKAWAANYANTGGVKVMTSVSAQEYYRLMYNAAAIVGNSSSALLEAPTLHLPAVNIGTRQAGRLRAENVIDVGYSRDNILDGIVTATQEGFRDSLRDIVNPYGDGHAAEKIVKALKAAGKPVDLQAINHKVVDMFRRKRQSQKPKHKV
jgi:UDP-hydrolysing UDP-N-acetyl-D-glucosamine 2-epimerase